MESTQLTTFELDEIIGVLLMGSPHRKELCERLDELQREAAIGRTLLKHGQQWRKDHDDARLREAIAYAERRAEEGG